MVVTASHKHAKISPRKARLVIDMVRGQTVDVALERLRSSHKRAAPMIRKVIRSAVASASDLHSADADVQATLDVLEAQLGRYQDLPSTPQALDCRDPDDVDLQGKLRWVNGEIAINFGKLRGKTLRSLAAGDPGYISWMLRKGIAPDAAGILKAALKGEIPTRAARDDDVG